jgi:hypothetical protein
MDNNQQLLTAVSAALRTAGYTNVVSQSEADGAVITAKKDAGGAYFRLTSTAKPVLPAQTTAGGPEAQAAPLQIMMAPAVADLHANLLQNPATAPAFGFSDDAIRLLK